MFDRLLEIVIKAIAFRLRMRASRRRDVLSHDTVAAALEEVANEMEAVAEGLYEI